MPDPPWVNQFNAVKNRTTGNVLFWTLKLVKCRQKALKPDNMLVIRELEQNYIR